MIVPCNNLHPRLIFASKAAAYPIAIPVGLIPGLTHKYKSREQRLAMDKRSSFFVLSVGNDELFITLTSVHQKTLMFWILSEFGEVALGRQRGQVDFQLFLLQKNYNLFFNHF